MDKLLDIIEWYQSIPKDYNDISTLIYTRKQLSSLNIENALTTSNAIKEAERCYAIRKIEIARIKAKYIQDGESASNAEAIAIKESSEAITKEHKYQGVAKGNKIVFDAVNKCLDSMASQIRFLIDEQNKINFTQEL